MARATATIRRSPPERQPRRHPRAPEPRKIAEDLFLAPDRAMAAVGRRGRGGRARGFPSPSCRRTGRVPAARSRCRRARCQAPGGGQCCALEFDSAGRQRYEPGQWLQQRGICRRRCVRARRRSRPRGRREWRHGGCGVSAVKSVDALEAQDRRGIVLSRGGVLMNHLRHPGAGIHPWTRRSARTACGGLVISTSPWSIMVTVRESEHTVDVVLDDQDRMLAATLSTRFDTRSRSAAARPAAAGPAAAPGGWSPARSRDLRAPAAIGTARRLRAARCPRGRDPTSSAAAANFLPNCRCCARC